MELLTSGSMIRSLKEQERLQFLGNFKQLAMFPWFWEMVFNFLYVIQETTYVYVAYSEECVNQLLGQHHFVVLLSTDSFLGYKRFIKFTRPGSATRKT